MIANKITRSCILLICLLVDSTLAAEKASFRIDFDSDPETIGDIKPAFLNFDQEALPAVPIKEIIRRYRRLFDETTVPSVRIDVLHRLTNLEAIYGDQKERSPEEERQLYKKALDSYEMIVGAGVYYGRIDELLYQTAKAYDLTGQYAKSLRSLEQLVGLYPNSHLAVEAEFRVGEANFSLGRYAKAEKAYQKSIASGKNSHFHDKAVFMLGWSQFKQEKYAKSNATFVSVLDTLNTKALGNHHTLLELEGIDGETARDTLRVLSKTFSYSEGGEAVNRLFNDVGDRQYAYMLYANLSALYLSQERYEDSAASSRAFIKRYPGSRHSPQMSQAIIDAYTAGRFPLKVWQEKAYYVASYGVNSSVWNIATSDEQVIIKRSLRTYLDQLSHYHYVLAQKAQLETLRAPQYLQAGEYYLLLVEGFPTDDQNGEFSFLAGESFYLAGDIERAIQSYEHSAYTSQAHGRALDAGYAAVLAHDRLKKNRSNQSFEDKSHRLESINLFATHFPDDKRVPTVLNQVANEYLQQGAFSVARDTSAKVLAHPLVTSEVRRSSLMVKGHSEFELHNYAEAESAYSAAASLTKGDNQSLSLLHERIAASIYRQGEVSIAANDRLGAVDQFLRLGRVVPTSRLRVNAQYDAATQLLELKQWRKAISLLKQFKNKYPSEPLASSVPDKLIFAYLESGDKLAAAKELVQVSQSGADTLKARKALYQAADLYAQAGVKDKSIDILIEYVNKYPEPFDLYIEAQHSISNYYSEKGNKNKRNTWLNNVIVADNRAGHNRTDRSRFLAAEASMQLAEDSLTAFKSVRLTLPLKKSLNKKSVFLKKLVDQLEQVPSYGVVQFTTQATYLLADTYRQLGSDIMTSQRPTSLDELQLEQYDLLLEEQAYPFEEKSIAVHEINIGRTKNGIYDKWVQESYSALSKMFPARYFRQEKLTSYDRNIQ